MNGRCSNRPASSAASSRSGRRRLRRNATRSRSNRARIARPAAGDHHAGTAWCRSPMPRSARNTVSGTPSTTTSCSKASPQRRDRERTIGSAARSSLPLRGVKARSQPTSRDISTARGDHRKAAAYLRLAAKNALLRYAPRESAALLHGAAAHLARTNRSDRLEMELTVMLELAQAQQAAGEPGLAASTLQRMERLAVETARYDDLVRAHLGLAQVNVASGARSSAPLCARRVRGRQPRNRSDACGIGHDSGRVDQAVLRRLVGSRSPIASSRRSHACRTVAGSEKRSLTIRLLFIHIMRSAYAAAWNTGRKLLAASLRSGDLADCLQNYHSVSVAALHLGRWLDAHRIAGEGAALADRMGASLEAASLRLQQAWVALEAQRWDDAQRLALGDRELIETCGCVGGLQMSLLWAVFVARARPNR